MGISGKLDQSSWGVKLGDPVRATGVPSNAFAAVPSGYSRNFIFLRNFIFRAKIKIVMYFLS